MKLAQLFFILLLAAGAGYLGARYAPPQAVVPVIEQEESVYDRVMRTGKIRCGYFLFHPISSVDANTGKLSGIAVEIFEKLGANLNLEIEWTEEVDFANLIPGLHTGRYDVVCTPLWPTAARARETEFIYPEFYAALGVFVRIDDDRFTGNLEAINDPNITISGVDGQIEQTVRDEQFPRAKMLSLPSMTDFSHSLMNVATGKADVTFVDRAAGHLFEQSHPGLLKNIADKEPLRIFPFSPAVKGGELRLKNMLDQAMLELHHIGHIERVLDSYEDYKGMFLKSAKPYEVQ